MSNLVSIGKILNFHGIKGEVKMGFSAGKEDLIKKLKQVYIFQNNIKLTYDVSSVRFHKNFAIIKFKQINSVNEVMEIKGLLVHITEDMLKSKLEKDEFLIKDLFGLAAFDTDGNKLGVVADIGENKASNLIEIQKANGLKFMVPFVKEWVPVVDLDNQKIVINMIEGIDTDSTKQDIKE